MPDVVCGAADGLVLLKLWIHGLSQFQVDPPVGADIKHYEEYPTAMPFSIRSPSWEALPDTGIIFSLQHRVSARLHVLKRNPVLVLIVVSLFLVLSGLSISALFYYCNSEMEKEFDGLMGELEHDILNSVGFALQNAGSGSVALALYARSVVLDTSSNVSVSERLESGFIESARYASERWPGSVALYMDPNAIVMYGYPPLFHPPLAPGFNFLQYPADVDFAAVIDRNLFFFGPFTNEESGQRYIISFAPIWLPADSEDTDFGYGVIEGCPECWNSNEKLNFFGETRSLIILSEELLSQSPLPRLLDKGLEITVKRGDLPDKDINILSDPEVWNSEDYDVCEKDNSELFNLEIQNLRWKVCARKSASKPLWFVYVIVGVILFSLVMALLLLELLLEKFQSNSMLEEILPKDVIAHLKKGISPYAEKYETVTILFCDIVGFTELSSALNPEQVVEMLDDLYSYYDKLTEKHNIYKVETIGMYYCTHAMCMYNTFASSLQLFSCSTL